MKKLIIAEKPSVARDLSRALGKFKKVDDHFENDEYVISSAVGHLVELYMPEDIDKKEYGFWRLGALPIIPDEFKLKPIDDKRSKERFNYLKKLLARKDIEEILNACDAGREGELIFLYIYELTGCKKPYRRVWMQSMTPGSIRKAFQSLREPEQVHGLQDAARSRSEADWLIGINGTRALTKRMFGKAKRVATVGRVQTPTLSIVLQREFEIRNFKPRDFWKIEGEFHILSGDYHGTLQVNRKIDKEDKHDKVDRIWDEEEAKSILEGIQKQPFATVREEKKRTRQSSGRLYDLTSLQRESNSRFGIPAGRTLQIAQALYEKHKMITYPRTSSRALPEDYIPTVKQTLGNLEGIYSEKAEKVLSQDWVKMNKRIFNNAQVSDHFAIIPTGEKPGKLTADEEKIYDMIARRFIAIFYPPAEFDVTTRLSRIDEFDFKTEGKVLVNPGYLEVYGKAQLDSELPPLSSEDQSPSWASDDMIQQAAGEPLAQPTSLEIEQDTTKPPPRFTEATLLSAMEGAGKLVDDDELAEAMKEKGLGTPATRAGIIDHLVKEKYLLRENRELAPTVKAENLFEFLDAVKVEALTSPDLTGEWEHKLLLMEQGKLSRDTFMKGITDLTKSIVDKTKNFEESIEDAPDTSIVSPTDGKPMRELLRAYKSQDEEITVYKTMANRKLDESEVQTLLNDRQVGPLDGFRSKAGKPFSAMLRLDPMNKVVFDFGENSGENGEGESLDLDSLNQIGTFPETGATVYETPNAYACENSIKGEAGATFRISRTMLGKTIPKEEVENLLKNGKTDLIKGFKSKRTGRNFDAFLILKPKGKIGFDFPPRPPKKKSAKKKTAKKKSANKNSSSSS